MTGFQVAPEDIRSLGKLIGQQADHAHACHRHVLDNTGLAGGEGWINEFSDPHDAIVGNTLSWLSGLSGRTLEAAELSVLASADYYAGTDAEAAGDLDAQLDEYRTNPPVVTDPTYYFLNKSEAGTFGEVLDPAERLTEPDDYAAQSAWRWEPKWADYVSIASAGRGAIMAATEALTWIGWMDRVYDPYEFLLKPVTGDWAGFRACVDVFQNTADACRDVNGNLRHSRIGLPTAWSGNAADSCERYLAEVCDALPAAAELLEAIADEYDTAAQAAFGFSSTVGGLISDLIDAAIVFAGAVAGGTASAPTVVGPIIGGGIAAYEAYSIMQIIDDFASVYGMTDNVMGTVKAGLDGFGRIETPDKSLPKLPEADRGSPIRQLPG